MGRKQVASNKKARHDYFIEDIYEAGLELTGTEIKSIRRGRVNLKESFARVDNGEVYVYGMNISPYEHGNIYNVDPLRAREIAAAQKRNCKIAKCSYAAGIDACAVGIIS